MTSMCLMRMQRNVSSRRLSTTDRRVGRVYVNQFTSRGYGLREAIKQAISPKSQRPQTASDLSQLLPAR
jgi:ribosomal protein L34E